MIYLSSEYNLFLIIFLSSFNYIFIFKILLFLSLFFLVQTKKTWTESLGTETGGIILTRTSDFPGFFPSFYFSFLQSDTLVCFGCSLS